MTSDILRFPDDSRFLFIHVLTKSLRSGDANVFAFKRGSSKQVCPVRVLKIYCNICKLLPGITLAPGFLFRSVTKSNSVCPQCLESATTHARLKIYTSVLSKHLSSDHFTIHGCRSGAAASLALEGVSLHKMIDHVRWRSSRTALHYIELKQMVNSAGTAAKLADFPSETGESYKRLNTLKGSFFSGLSK